MNRNKMESMPLLLATRLLSLIESGEVKEGMKMPSIRETVRLAGMSQGTVIEAFKILEDGGHIESMPGSGYYVKSKNPVGQPVSGNGREVKKIKYDPAMDLAINADNKKLLASFGLAVPADELIPLAALKKHMMQAIRKEDIHKYSLPPGHEGLRKEIAKRYLQTGLSVHYEDIFLCHGATEAFYAIVSELLKPGSLIAMETPVYGGFISTVKKLNLRILEIPVDASSGLNTEHLEQQLKNGHRPGLLLTIPTFQNPAGCTMNQKRREHLMDLAKKYNFFIIEDDIYAAIHHGPRRESTLKSLQSERVFLISSFAKTIAPSYRTGWMIVPEKFKEPMLKRLRTQSLGNSRMIEEVLYGFLAQGGFERHLRKLRRESFKRMHVI